VHTDTHSMKKPAGDGNPKAGHTDPCTLASHGDSDKEFRTLRAEYALRGHALHRTNPGDGPVEFWAERWGLVRYLPTIDAARRFLDAIGGRL